MTKKKILICDDLSSVRAQWKKTLEGIPAVKRAFDIETVGEEFKTILTDLEKRRRKARNNNITAPDWGENLFDDTDILIIDYDLLDFNKEDYITGEGVAYLARCYSRCGLIIALNQFGVNSFDLTLKCNPYSFADLNLGSRQLSNPGLWGEPWKGFRPWYWPMLPIALEAFERRAKDLKGNLGRKILTYLGFPQNVSETLPRSTKEYLGSGDRPETVTFKEFVEESGNGLRRKDKTLDDESTARIAATRIAKWLERMVLSGQDVLVDAPHLVSRFPSLLTNGGRKRETWNKTASFKGLNSIGIQYRRIAEFRFDKHDWISRPAWFWNRLSNFERIAEVADPWSTERPDLVFCEDISRFLPREAAREFVADLPSPFVRRFVVEKNSKEGQKFVKDLSGIDYVPAVRFSL